MGNIIQRGVAKIETTAGTMDAVLGAFVQTYKGKHNIDLNSVRDFEGFSRGWSARDEHIILTPNFKLTGTSLALAKLTGALLRPFAEVTISGADLDWMNATGIGGFFTGHWCYMGDGTVDLSNTETGGQEFSLRKYALADQNSAQFVIPS